MAAWNYLWRHHWIIPERHCRIATRYCQLQDLLAAAFARVAADGLMTTGSTGQSRAHPAMAEIRMLTTESRLTEVELGLTPAAESKAGADRRPLSGPMEAMILRQRERGA